MHFIPTFHTAVKVRLFPDSITPGLGRLKEPSRTSFRLPLPPRQQGTQLRCISAIFSRRAFIFSVLLQAKTSSAPFLTTFRPCSFTSLSASPLASTASCSRYFLTLAHLADVSSAFGPSGFSSSRVSEILASVITSWKG